MSTLKTDTIVDVDGLGAPSFPNGLSGSASLLTGLPSSQLTGALPAISGAALTNLPSGSTTSGDVGTYQLGRPLSNANFAIGATTSSFHAWAQASETVANFEISQTGANTVSQSGTWRCISGAAAASNQGFAGLWIRIS